MAMNLLQEADVRGWQSGLCCVYAPSLREAKDFYRNFKKVIALQVTAIGRDFCIYYDVMGGQPDPKKRLIISPKLAAEINDSDDSIVPSHQLELPQSQLTIPELELDFNGIYHNPHPIFFYDFEDGDIIFANLAAVRAILTV